MKKLIFSFFTAILFVSCVTVNAGRNMVSREYQVKSSFNSIKVSGNVDVDYTPSDKVSIVASAKENVLPTLKIYVKNNTIYLETESTTRNREFISDNNTVKVKLSAPVMVSYSTSGNSGIDIKGPVNLQGNLKVCSSVNSGIDFEGPVNLQGTLQVNASGNSKIEFGYKTECQDVKVVADENSSVDFDKQLVCTTFNSSSSCNSSIDVSSVLCNNIVLDSSGNAGIDVDGINAKSVTAESSGNSTIKLSGSTDSANLQSSGNSGIKARKLNTRNISSSTSGNSSIQR